MRASQNQIAHKASRKAAGELNSHTIYAIRLQAPHGHTGIRALRHTLKALWRRHGLRCVSAREESARFSGPAADHATKVEP